MGALNELSLVIFMIGGPVLCVILWEEYKARKIKKQWRELTNWKAMGRAINEGINEGYSNEVARQRQKCTDDQTFKTVEEYRNEFD